jgi:hypothetical protein
MLFLIILGAPLFIHAYYTLIYDHKGNLWAVSQAFKLSSSVFLVEHQKMANSPSPQNLASSSLARSFLHPTPSVPVLLVAPRT